MDNHLFITLHDNRVTYHTTTGSQGGMPTGVTSHDDWIAYLKNTIPHTSLEIRDDRTPKVSTTMVKRIAIEALEILGACIAFTIFVLIACYFFYNY